MNWLNHPYAASDARMERAQRMAQERGQMGGGYGYQPVANPGAQMLSYFGQGPGFAGAMYGAMNQMAGLQNANANRATATNFANADVMKHVLPEAIRSSALRQTFGALAGKGNRDTGPLRWRSQIGQGINLTRRDTDALRRRLMG